MRAPRGREDIFLDDVDHQELLKTLAEACQKTGWQVHAYRENHSGELHRETAEPKAHRIIAQEMARLGWEEPDLACGLKNDPRKLAIAVRLRKETTLPIKWIAARLQMGTTKSARSMLHRWMQQPGKSPCIQLQFQPMACPLFGSETAGRAVVVVAGRG